MKKYIKMNDNTKYLSLGNMFNIIKNNSNNKSSAMQSELFCILFNLSDVSNTTVNNYCIGYRAISIEYKKIYIDFLRKYKKDKMIFLDILISLISILDEYIYKKDNALENINNNVKLKNVCNNLINLSNEDSNINDEFRCRVSELYVQNNLYECFIEFLFYVVLENKQPLYVQSIKYDINEEELNEYLSINLYEGISYISSLLSLSKKNNMYANAELGSLEYSGMISGKQNLYNSFNYYLSAAKKNHPKACWMVANLILNKKIESNIYDFDFAWNYLHKAIELGSISAINTLGNCYRLGLTLDNKVDLKKAEELYLEASEYGYVYAYNNLGLLYESKDFNKALEYFKISADMGNSWSLNKVGEIYRKQERLEDAYFYYLESTKCPLSEMNYYGYYNLAKYYYLEGDKKDLSKCKEYLLIASEHGIKEAIIFLQQFGI